MQVALSPDGRSAYVTNSTAGSVSQYDVTAAGALSPKSPPASRPARQPAGIAVSPDGASAYVTNQVPTAPSRSSRSPRPAAPWRPRRSPWTPAARPAASSPPLTASTWPTSPRTRSRSTPPTARGAERAAPGGRHPRTPVRRSRSPPTAEPLRRRLRRRRASASTTSPATAPSPPRPRRPRRHFRPQAVVAVKPRDEQAPTIDLRTPAEGAQYDLGADVRADYSCADEGGSGLPRARATCPTAPAGHLDAGRHAFTVVARDGDGNETTVTHGYSRGPDEQAPTVDLRTPPQGAQYDLGADVRADYSCADEGGSGLASCTGDVPDGARWTPRRRAPTTSRSSRATAPATRRRSRTATPPPSAASASRASSDPIHNGSVVRAGDAIPIVFSLGGYQRAERPGRRLAQQRAGRLPASRHARRAASRPEPARSGPALQLAGPATTSSPGRPGRRGPGPAAPSSSA